MEEMLSNKKRSSIKSQGGQRETYTKKKRGNFGIAWEDVTTNAGDNNYGVVVNPAQA